MTMAHTNTNVWRRFKGRYPNADFSQFHAADFFGHQNIMLHEDDGSEATVFDDSSYEFRPSIYFSGKMKRALGIATGFPLELTLNPAPKLPVLAVFVR